MKKILHVLVGAYPLGRGVNAAVALTRIFLGLLMIDKGSDKLFLSSGRLADFLSALGLPLAEALALAVMSVQLVCGIALLAGFFSRASAFAVACIAVLGIAVTPGLGLSVAKLQLSVTHAVLAIVIAILGAGRYSLDFWLFRSTLFSESHGASQR